MELINDALPSIGAISLGYLTYKLLKYIVSKIKLNPLKTYIRKEVVNYLNEIKND
tara:strand:- start:135 stop:299 length:165 start_codon:yes stop_codon:yes gene_type:complete